MNIQFAQSDPEIQQCFPVLSQLRPHLQPEGFVEQVRRQMQRGYQLVFLEVPQQAKLQVVGAAGFCLAESLAWGKYLYVYDLVVDQSTRSVGYGQCLFDWLVGYAKQQGCEQLHLDSGVQRFDTHRFYLRKRMYITSHHFSMRVE